MPEQEKINNRLNLDVTGDQRFPSSQTFVSAAPVRRKRIQASKRPDITCETSAETPILSRRYPQNQFLKKGYFGVLVSKLEYRKIGVRKIGGSAVLHKLYSKDKVFQIIYTDGAFYKVKPYISSPVSAKTSRNLDIQQNTVDPLCVALSMLHLAILTQIAPQQNASVQTASYNIMFFWGCPVNKFESVVAALHFKHGLTLKETRQEAHLRGFKQVPLFPSSTTSHPPSPSHTSSFPTHLVLSSSMYYNYLLHGYYHLSPLPFPVLLPLLQFFHCQSLQ